MEKDKNAARALIFGGAIVLLSTLESETMIPWYVKVAGGLGLIINGVSQVLAKRKK